MSEAEEKIGQIIRRHLKEQIEVGIVWTVVLMSAAFALGVFLGLLAL